MTRFRFTTEELELLAIFEEGPSLEATAKAYGRDPTVVSRILKRISEKGPVLEKISGRWRLTAAGRNLNALTKDMSAAQGAILNEETVLRVGSNREFVTRMLVPALAPLRSKLKVSSMVIKSYEQGCEKALLDGQIDIALDCGRPFASDIAFKLCAAEPMAIVCSAEFHRRHREAFRREAHRELPVIACERLGPDRAAGYQIAFHFNDVAAARAACLEGLGWMMAPIYAVKDELASRRLLRPYDQAKVHEKYGVWWLRSRRYLGDQVKVLEQWLAQADFGE